MTTILVVDDRAPDRELLTGLFSHSGYKVVEAADGAEALRLAITERPDIVISDILLPRLDGYGLVRELRASPETARTPIIFYTATFNEWEARDLARELGVAHVLAKPADPENILRIVAKVLAASGIQEDPASPGKFEQRHQQLLIGKLLRQVEALNRSEERFKTIFRMNPNAVVIASLDNGDILEVNEAFCNNFGYSRDGLIGKPTREVEGWPAVMDHATTSKLLARHGEVNDLEASVRTRSGEIKTVLLSIRTIELDDRQCAVTVLNDITERKRLEEELVQSQHYIRNVIDSMPSQIIGVDAQGKLTHWNLAAEHSVGIPFKTVKGKLLTEAIPQFAEYLDSINLAIRERQPVSLERQTYWGDGELHYQNIMFYPLVANNIEGVIIRVDNVTERVRISDILIQSEKMASVGSLAAGMAHEINNPLGSILQSAQILLKRFGTASPANLKAAEECNCTMEGIQCYFEKRQALQFLESIRESGTRAARIVRTMLDFSRKNGSTHVPVNLNDILDKSIELASSDYDLKNKFDFRHITIVKEYDADLPTVYCTQSEIEQVVLNLLKNAAQAMACQPTGRTPTLKLLTKSNAGTVSIVVEDNGPGMEEKLLKRIFEPFFTTKKPGEGTGLGLSVSFYIIVNNHGGTISVESEPDEWTRFTIELPVGKPD